MLAEIQCLLNPTFFGSPRRTTAGIDTGRLGLLIAVLEQKCKLKLSDKDVYLNVVGNLKIDERGVDLAVALCLASALCEIPLPVHTALIGEVGLTGEIRPVAQMEPRIKECVRLGYKNILVANGTRCGSIDGANVVKVNSINDAIDIIRYCPSK